MSELILSVDQFTNSNGTLVTEASSLQFPVGARMPQVIKISNRISTNLMEFRYVCAVKDIENDILFWLYQTVSNRVILQLKIFND